MLENQGAASPTETASDQDDLAAWGCDPPLDLVHLARQCQGDDDLEEELLGLFRLQSRALTAQLAQGSALSLESKAYIAHRLRGSALAVGARRVARAARRFEECASAARDFGPSGDEELAAVTLAIAALAASVEEALAEIQRIRG